MDENGRDAFVCIKNKYIYQQNKYKNNIFVFIKPPLFTPPMKFYETQYDDYLQSLKKYNMHPELEPIIKKYPATIQQLPNVIIYGATGNGKYTQCLSIIQKYSASKLKYDKKIKMQYEKQTYMYRISDIHYEIDMSLLGCNSRLLWHDLFFQILDIISMKPDRSGIILCKNFHTIHSELLDVFYSYIQECNCLHQNLNVRFFFLTEHLSFIPNSILNCCVRLNVKKPEKEHYLKMIDNYSVKPRVFTAATSVPGELNPFIDRISFPNPKKQEIKNMLENMDKESVLNLKEIMSFSLVKTVDEMPKDIFNVICHNIIDQMLKIKTMDYMEFRDTLYDILVYNLDITDCLWYIISYFIETGRLSSTTNMMELMDRVYLFLKHYNNNYRPIYHIESIFYYLIIQIHGYSPEELPPVSRKTDK